MRFSAAATTRRILPERLAQRARPLADRIDGLVFAADERGKASRMSLIAFSIRIVSAALAFLSQVLLARWMGSFEYGIFVLVWVTMVIVGNISCFGFHTSIIRFLPEYLVKGDLPSLRGMLFASRLVAILASSALALAGALGVWFFSDRIESYYVIPFYLGLICLPMIALSDVLQGISRANTWAVSALAPIYLIRPVLILAFMGAALLAGFSHDARTAIIAAIAATYVTTIGQLVFVTAGTDRKIPQGPNAYHMREWVAVSLPIFLVESFFFLMTNADVLMVGRYLDPHDVAVYYAAVKILALVHFVYFAVKAGAAQRFAALANDPDSDSLGEFARETVHWTFWPSVLMAAVILLTGHLLLRLFGAEFTAGYPMLFVLVLGVVARASVGPAESLLTMSGNQAVCAAVYGAALATNVVLNVILLPVWGLWGAAVATAIAMSIEAAALLYTVWRRTGILMFIGLPAGLARGNA
ncbi:multi antimicrobial extrusion protein MatE [Zhengella mangrovi]|uniref:Multi antimicrobial extrusion protein MatE n=1 Tax=Zhengella mangrovi TaxID=1982044 RepID=A0A2G1QJA0_9HYPH|nr:lipopolysaccharide biosynthesis protein [Zhengella mangrovi]PHP65603.1 multi antimicrobial extrusion protein MatE [Zhengella mangrovi]